MPDTACSQSFQGPVQQGVATIPVSCLTLFAIKNHQETLTRVGMVFQPYALTLLGSQSQGHC